MCNSRDIQGQCPKLCYVRHWTPNLAASPVHISIPVPSCWCHPRLCLMLMVSYLCPRPWHPMTIYKITAPFPCLFHQYMSVCQHHYVESLKIVSDVDGQSLLSLFVHHLQSHKTISTTVERIPHLHHAQAQSVCGCAHVLCIVSTGTGYQYTPLPGPVTQ
jgi:hypothetical protein